MTRSDPLGAETNRLWRLLREIIEEQEGADLRRLVERTRRRAMRARRGDAPARRILDRELDGLPSDRAEVVVRAFLLHFRLANLAEERHRVRILEERGRRTGNGPGARGSAPGPRDDTLAGVIRTLRSEDRFPTDPVAAATAIARLRIQPVLTAHPTEARRRTALQGLGRIARLLAARDDPRLTPSAGRALDERIREEVTILWRTAEARTGNPSPLDEVRAALVFFDSTIYSLVPAVQRALQDAVGADPASQRAGFPAILRWGSWIGADRDGNPAVTAEITEHAARIQADHVLRGHEAVATRLMQAISAAIPDDRLGRPLTARLLDDAETLPAIDSMLRRRFPEEPFRRRFGAIAERLRRTRRHLTGDPGPTAGHYRAVSDLLAEIAEIQASLAAADLGRIAAGSVQDFRWQVETFGFHLAELEVRQHASVHRAAVAALRGGVADQATTEVGAGVTLSEVLDTFRGIERLQVRFGDSSAERVVVSFSESAADATDVLELASVAAGPAAAAALDVVPLFESANALRDAGEILAGILADPRYRAHLGGRGDRQEVMLGYSDSNKESGFVAANWLLYGAQAELARVAAANGIELTLFHGRGGTVGRGGGRVDRAIVGQPPGTVRGRLKLTEQGEVVAARYGNPAIALRHLELLAGAVIAADATSAPAAPDAAGLMDRLAAASSSAYRGLVYDDSGFAGFFRRITPIELVASMRLGSRPASRRARERAEPTGDGELEELRAIPWGFAWAQARIELPGWYGLGSAYERVRRDLGEPAMVRLAELYRTWPFLTAVIDHAELALARSDLGVARRYSELATGRGDERRWAAIEAEHELSVRAVLAMTGASRLLERSPAIARSIALRNPDVETLSELQVGLLVRLRALPRGSAEAAAIERLTRLTISGVAAGLQVTG